MVHPVQLQEDSLLVVAVVVAEVEETFLLQHNQSAVELLELVPEFRLDPMVLQEWEEVAALLGGQVQDQVEEEVVDLVLFFLGHL
jgi:hypothetical protein